MIDWVLLLIAATVLLFGLVSGRLERSPITPPMAFVTVGLLAHYLARSAIGFDIPHSAVHLFAELTLVLVLFTDASRIDLSELRRNHGLPVRLLAIGMPLTIGAGLLVAQLFFPELSIWEAALIAAILAPTDAALGQAVLTNELVPERIRRALTVESGLNDGIALPVVLIFLSLATAGGEGAAHWGRVVALQLLLGPLVGMAVGYIGGRLVTIATRAEWMTKTFQELASIGLSVLAFALAELVGGNGFIAAFVAGLTLGNSARPICGCLVEFGESEGQLLSLLVFMIFGYQLAPHVLDVAEPRLFAYGLLSLTVLRMVPVAISLAGAGLHRASVLFIGWFGPRGLASILFALVVVEESQFVNGEVVSCLVMTTVLLSVFAHGLTAEPLSRRYGAHVSKLDVGENDRVS